MKNGEGSHLTRVFSGEVAQTTRKSVTLNPKIVSRNQVLFYL